MKMVQLNISHPILIIINKIAQGFNGKITLQ